MRQGPLLLHDTDLMGACQPSMALPGTCQQPAKVLCMFADPHSLEVWPDWPHTVDMTQAPSTSHGSKLVCHRVLTCSPATHVYRAQVWAECSNQSRSSSGVANAQLSYAHHAMAVLPL